VATALLYIALFGVTVGLGRNVATVVHATKVSVKAIHHHTTKPLYRHVLKPIATGKAGD
jgi:hypothetical protein